MSTIDILNNISTQIYIYGYSFIFVTGLFGNTLNIIIFLTKLKENVCTSYLLIAEISDTLTLLIFILPSIVGIAYGVNGTGSNLAWCIITNWASDMTNLVSNATLCLASIDRYLCSSRRVQLRQLSSRKVARISITVAILCSFLLTIPNFLYWYIDSNGQGCIDDERYVQYASYFLIPVMFSFVPLTTLSVFGYKAYRNLQQIHPVHQSEGATGVLNRQVHPYQRLDNQLTRMLIPQIVLFLFQTTSFFAINVYITATDQLDKSKMRWAIENLLEAIIFVFYDTYTCVSFYIYFTRSKTFRANVKRLLRICRRQRDEHGTQGPTNTAAVVTYNSAIGGTALVV